MKVFVVLCNEANIEEIGVGKDLNTAIDIAKKYVLEEDETLTVSELGKHVDKYYDLIIKSPVEEDNFLFFTIIEEEIK